MRSITIEKLVLLISMLIFAVSCEPTGITTLRIVTANVKEQQTGGSDEQVAERLYKSGRFIDKEFPAWTFIAASELASEKLTGRIPGIGPVRFRAKKLDCPHDNVTTKLISINCLVRGLNNADYLFYQKGEMGIIARGLAIEQLPLSGESFVSKLIGPERDGGIQRRFIASRFRLIYSDLNVLFVSVHLNHGGSEAEIMEELQDLIDNIKALYIAGDLTPIIAGDFNCHVWSARHRAVIYKDFFLATPDSGAVDNVFIGRPTSFQENGGFLVASPNTTKVRKPIDSSTGRELSDHPYIAVDLIYNQNEQPAILPPPVTTAGKGCKNP